jgi:hypothetical protein
MLKPSITKMFFNPYELLRRKCCLKLSHAPFLISILANHLSLSRTSLSLYIYIYSPLSFTLYFSFTCNLTNALLPSYFPSLSPLSHSLLLTRSIAHTHTQSHFFTQKHSVSLSPSLPLSLSPSLPLSLSPSLPLSLSQIS